MKYVRLDRRLVVGGLALAMAGCGSAPASSSSVKSQTTTVKFSEVIRSVFYAPQYVALAKGFFRQQHLKVNLVTSEGSNIGAAALLSGSANIALVGPETTIYIHNQHGTSSLKVFEQLTGTDGSFLLSRHPIRHFSWADLNGQTIIGWRPGSDPQMVLQTALVRHGVHANVLTNIAPQAMVGAFESGKAPFIQEYEPVVSSLIQHKQAYLVTSMAKAAGTYPETSYVATSAYIKSHPKVIQEWTNAIHQGVLWTDSHTPQQVAKMIQSYFSGTSLSSLAASVSMYQHQNTWPKSPLLTRAEYRALENTLAVSGVVKRSQDVPYRDVIDTQFAKAALKQ